MNVDVNIFMLFCFTFQETREALDNRDWEIRHLKDSVTHLEHELQVCKYNGELYL